MRPKRLMNRIKVWGSQHSSSWGSDVLGFRSYVVSPAYNLRGLSSSRRWRIRRKRRYFIRTARTARRRLRRLAFRQRLAKRIGLPRQKPLVNAFRRKSGVRAKFKPLPAGRVSISRPRRIRKGLSGVVAGSPIAVSHPVYTIASRGAAIRTKSNRTNELRLVRRAELGRRGVITTHSQLRWLRLLVHFARRSSERRKVRRRAVRKRRNFLTRLTRKPSRLVTTKNNNLDKYKKCRRTHGFGTNPRAIYIRCVERMHNRRKLIRGRLISRTGSRKFARGRFIFIFGRAANSTRSARLATWGLLNSMRAVEKRVVLYRRATFLGLRFASRAFVRRGFSIKGRSSSSLLIKTALRPARYFPESYLYPTKLSKFKKGVYRPRTPEQKAYYAMLRQNKKKFSFFKKRGGAKRKFYFNRKW